MDDHLFTMSSHGSHQGAPDAQWQRTCLPMQERCIQSLGREDPLEKEMATHSNILVYRTPMDRRAWTATVHGVAKSET